MRALEWKPGHHTLIGTQQCKPLGDTRDISQWVQVLHDDQQSMSLSRMQIGNA